MDTGIVIVIVSSLAAIVVAIIKFSQSKNVKKDCASTLCPEHSGVIERFKAGDAMFASIGDRLIEIEKDNNETQRMVFEIHSKIMGR